uniref:DUF6603 domain-containing protein n=1 Tax=Candidatus Kentrum sp. SD TaxID=2126332 RepID=A0A451BHN5_9GAMM|nr:MAG: hypothetical protein BECKSD772D_GA0070982_100215 [Candidatus Kentron sp. SD]
MNQSVSKTDSTVTKTFFPCLSVGDSIIAPELEIKDLGGTPPSKCVRVSLIANSLQGPEAKGLRDAFGIDEEDLKLTPLKIIGMLGISLDPSIEKLLKDTPRISALDYFYHSGTKAISFNAEVEAEIGSVTGSLSMDILSAPNGTIDPLTPEASKNKKAIILGVNLGVELPLDELLPLVDPADLPRFELGVHLLHSNRDIDKKGIDRILELGEGVRKDAGSGKDAGSLASLAGAELKQGFSLVPTIRIGDVTIPLRLALPSSQKDEKGNVVSKKSPPAKPQGGAVPANKQLGPISIDNFGVGFEDGDIVLSVDGSLRLSAFQMALLGLALEVNLAKLMKGDITGVGFDLDGLFMAFGQGSVAISGGFLRMEIGEGDKKRTEYVGQLGIKAGTLSIIGLGAYSRLLNGDTSLFIYAALNFPLGGIPQFFVEGLSLGFGYNRGINVPGAHEINRFPLVSALSGEAAAGSMPPEIAQLREKMEALSRHLPAISGQYVLAAGIKFSTFKQVVGLVVVMVEFGERFALHVAGLATLALPPRETGIPTVAGLEMGFKISFVPEEGMIGIEAALTENSFLLSKDARLTGGFAFYSWFLGDNAGDFVISMGGYHPKFARPAHYPIVPRLGFLWRVSDILSFKGGMYATLTPLAIMAGGSIEAILRTGKLDAQFGAKIDFIIYWQPFSYDARFSIAISVAYELLFFTARTELGADLHVWGPDFSGTARIDWAIFSFDIAFGAAKTKPKPKPIEWAQFEKSHLPKKPTEFSQPAITAGELGVQKDDKEEWHLVDPDAFELRIDSQIPINAVEIGNTEEEGPAFHIAPMGGDKGATVDDWKMAVTVERPGNVGFVVEGIRKNHPIALWGKDFQPDIKGKERILSLLSGAMIRPGPGKPPKFTEPVDADAFAFQDIVENDPFWQWGAPLGDAVRADATKADDSARIRNTLSEDTVADRRAGIGQWFGHAGELSLSRMRGNLDSAFVGVPQIVQ